MKTHKIPKLTIQKYLNQERETDTKYEYHDGEIYALAGGTINHAMLCGNIFGEIRNGLRNNKSNCKPFTSEIKINIDKANSFVYPDCTVVCGEIETSRNEVNAITNPILIVEVLSKSTALYDRSDKFHLYRKLSSLKEYVLIEQNRYIVDVNFKSKKSDFWKITRYEGLEEIIHLQSLDIKIAMKDLYQDVKIDLPL